MKDYGFDDRADYDGNGVVDDFEQEFYFLEMDDEDRDIAAGRGIFGSGCTGGRHSQKQTWGGMPVSWVIIWIFLMMLSIVVAFAD